MRILAPILCLVFIGGVLGCRRHSVHSHGGSRMSTNGTAYFFDLVEVDLSSAPIVVLARSGGPGKDYALKSEASGSRYLVDGIPLTPVTEPSICFKEDGKLKTKVVSKSGVWLPLFRKNGPTLDELSRVFEQLEQDKH